MRIAIVGAGVSGLAAARRLLPLGHELLLYDASRGGGLASGFPFPGQPGTWLEKFYHHLFTSDTRIIELARAHGLGHDLLWQPSRAGLFAGGRLWPFGTPLDLLRFRPLGGLGERLKMGLSLRVFQSATAWQRFDRVTCEEFFARRGCLRGYRALWEPLLKAKFGDAYGRVPAAFLWGRIHTRLHSRRRGREQLGYLRGGFVRLIQAMLARLAREGVRVRLNTPVRRIERLERGLFRVCTADSEDTVERVVWTPPPAHLAAILEPPEDRLRRLAARIEYIGACCLVLLLRRRLGDLYWINNLDPEITFGGVIEHTNLVSPAHYGGLHVAYIVNYLPTDHDYMRRSAEELLRIHLPSLQRLYPAFTVADVERCMVFRSPVASPVYDLGFRERMPPFVGWSPGIGILGMSQIYPLDRNMNQCVATALSADVEALLGTGGPAPDSGTGSPG